MKYLLFLVCLFLTAVWLSEPASARDSYYYMVDDGVQDEEEMQEEAMYIHEECASNVYIRSYYSCECVAGAFLQKREEMGGIMPQDEILNEIYRGGLGSCANTLEMAGEMYEYCKSYARSFREYEPDNEEFCECAANSFSINFTKNPYLRTKYIENLRARALVDCEDRGPNGLPRKMRNYN